VSTQPEDQQAATQHSTGPKTVTLSDRLRRLWRNGEQRPSGGSPDVGWAHRLDRLESHMEHLELVLEGLQDAVHRRAVREDDRIDELRRRTQPDQIARDLSRNARTLGL
jgi:hypothetical protein